MKALTSIRGEKDTKGAAGVSEALRPLKGFSYPLEQRNSYWLITKRRRGRVDVWTMGLADGRSVLPVFSFEEEAALFLRLGVQGIWQVRPAEAGELVSLLYGPCRGVQLVALDPVSDVETAVVNRCVSLGRKRFVDVLLRKAASVRLFSIAP
jgi:hypothetical protein